MRRAAPRVAATARSASSTAARTQARVGMQDEQPAPLGRGDAGPQLAPRAPVPKPPTRHPRAAASSAVPSVEPPSAMTISCSSGEGGEVLQEPRKARSFVQRRDDDGQERGQLRTSAWNRVRRSRVTGPGFPLPMFRPSSERIPTISLAVPVKKASSAV